MTTNELVLQAIKRADEQNKRIGSQNIKRFFGSLLAAHKLQLEMQGIEDTTGRVEKCFGNIGFLRRFFKSGRAGLAKDMKDQLKHYHDSADYERKAVVDYLDHSLEELDLARSQLEIGSTECTALGVVIRELGQFAWAFKDLRSDMKDLFAIPDVQQIFWAAMAKEEMGIKAV